MKGNRISVFRSANRFPVYRLQHYVFTPLDLYIEIIVSDECKVSTHKGDIVQRLDLEV